MIEFDDLVRRFDNPKMIRSGHADIKRSYSCRCPAHADSRNSLTVSLTTDGKNKVFCEAGCDTEAVLGAVGLSLEDILPERKRLSCLDKKAFGIGGEGARAIAEYEYRDGSGRYLYSKVRFEGGTIPGKEIRYYVVDHDQDTATPGKGGAPNVLYRLPEFRKLRGKAQFAIITEGEKDTETTRKQGNGFGCVTTPGGASDWKAEFAQEFRGLDVVIFRDNDVPGLDLAEQIRMDLRRYAHSVRIINPSRLEKGDITDFLTKEGGTAQGLKDMIQNTTDVTFGAWVTRDDRGREKGVNTGILAECIAENESYFILRNPLDDKDALLFYESGVYQRWNRNEFKHLVKRYVGAARATDNMLNNVYSLFMATDCNICTPSELDGDPRYLNFRNGLYSVSERKLIPHNPKVMSLFQYNFDYNPTNVSHPVFDGYIQDLCRKPDGSIDQGEILIIQEYMGFILSGEPMSKIKAALVLWSRQGNSGKSVLIRLISNLLGVDRIASIKLRELVSENRFILGTLPESRVIACGDESNSNVKDSSIFKALTGGDPVKIEPKGRQGYSFIYKGGFVIACNGLPCFEDDHGNHLFDRLLILPCEHHITEETKDPDLDRKLSQERQAIFNWALEGLYRLMDNGFRFSRSESATLSKEEYRRAMDNVYRFVSERYEITGQYSDRIRKADFDRAYQFWADKDSTIKAVAPKNLPARLEAIGVTTDLGNVGDVHHVKVYRGIRKKGQQEDIWAEDDGTVQTVFDS